MARQGLTSYWWVIAILLVLAGFAWLTRHPEARILEQARDWPVVGGLAIAFRDAYLPTPPAHVEPVPEPESEIEVIVLPSVDVRQQREVWVQAGASLHAEPDQQSEVLVTTTSISNLSIIEQRGDWYRVWLPHSGARPLRVWIWLEDYQPPTQEILRRADPVLPLPATPPDPERVSAARRLMLDGGVEVRCGRQPLYTDVPDDEIVGLCESLTMNLEALYRERYGLLPAGPAAEAVLYFREAADYREFRDLERIGFDTGLAHATPARGYLALFKGERADGEVLATLVHELTHLLNRRFLGPALPPWLNEGIADDLAESRIDPDGVIHPDRLGGETLRHDGRIVILGGLAAAIDLQEAIRVDNLPTLRELVGMEERQFHRSDRVLLHYALSSFWIRYLASGFDPDVTRGFRQFLQDVAAGETLTVELLQRRLETDWDELESEFRLWVHLQFIRPVNENKATSR